MLNEYFESDLDKGLMRKNMVKALLEKLPEDEDAFRASASIQGN